VKKNFWKIFPSGYQSPYPLFLFLDIYLYMEEIISKIVGHIVKKKFPQFTDVQVTSEYDYSGDYMDKSFNITYNIFLTIDYSDFSPINDSGEWDRFKALIRETIRSSGIKHQIRIYLNFPGDEMPY